eukprot:6206027-Pleurochrysis_carterae.AAC.2
MYAHESARLEPGFRYGHAGFDGEGTAPEGHDGHDSRLDAGEQLIGRPSCSWWAAGAIQHVDGMLDGIVPE